MTHSVPQRIAVIFPLIGAAFLLAALFVPAGFTSAGWAAALVCFAAALVGGIVARRRQKAEVAQRP